MVLGPLAGIAAVNLVWMGLALGALLRRLGAPAGPAWVPVLRWVVAAREGRTAPVAVAVARGVAFVAGAVAIGALVAPSITGDVTPAIRVTLVASVAVTLVGTLVGWVLWIQGAGTIELRMRAPRGLSWLAALSPVIWASVMGWGPYRAVAGPVAGRPATAETFAEAAEMARSAVEVTADIHASETYRSDLLGTVVRRALAEAAAA